MPTTKEKQSLSDRLPTPAEIESAAEASIAIATAIEMDGSLKVNGYSGEPLKISPALGALITDLLGIVARGEMVTLVPTGASLTTKRAADMLNVSRPYLTKLLKEGAIPHTRVGSHRRISLEDLLKYIAERDKIQREGLDELIALGQEYDAA